MTPSQQSNDWLISIAGDAASPSMLLCVGHAGAGAHLFLPWKELFADNVEVVAVRLPGRERLIREPPVDDWRDLKNKLIPTVIAKASGRPVAVFGHCFGAIVALATAQVLEREAIALSSVFISSHGPPSPPFDSIAELPKEEFWAELERAGGLAPQLLATPEFLDLLEPTLRSDVRLYSHLARTVAAMRPAALQAPLTIIVGTEENRLVEKAPNWSSLAHVEEIVVRTGGHFPRDEQWRAVGAIVRERLGPAAAS